MINISTSGHRSCSEKFNFGIKVSHCEVWAGGSRDGTMTRGVLGDWMMYLGLEVEVMRFLGSDGGFMFP